MLSVNLIEQMQCCQTKM